MYLRKCKNCFRGTITPVTAKKFKLNAYSLLGLSPLNSVKDRISSDINSTINIVIFNRGLRYREMSNSLSLIKALETADRLFQRYRIHFFNVSNHNSLGVSFDYQSQIEMAYRADCLIATHGGFQSNVIYMNEGSLMIELSDSSYQLNEESENFRYLSQMFLVNYGRIHVESFKHLKQHRYTLSSSEISSILSIIKKFSESL